MRACDDCKYYFGETCMHPDICNDFEFGGLGDTFEWLDETPDWCPLNSKKSDVCDRYVIINDEGDRVYNCIGCNRFDCPVKGAE